MTFSYPWEGTIAKNKLCRPTNTTPDDQGYNEVYKHEVEDGDSQKTSKITYGEGQQSARFSLNNN